jgi:hypothetical protein
MYDASGGVSIRQKIIDEKDAVLVGQELAVYTHGFSSFRVKDQTHDFQE